MIDDLRDRLDDVSDTQVPFNTKLRYLNRGQAAMFPKIFRVVRDTSLEVLADEFEYDFPAGVGTGKVISVEVETGDATDRYQPLQRYDVIQSITSPILSLIDLDTPPVGARFRITTADRLAPFVAASYAAAGSETYTGPMGTEELPVLYAMGLATARPLDERMATNRMATMQQSGAIGPNDIMQVSQFWLAQFEMLLERMAMPWPVARN
jgi:hypothetical protein